MREQEPATTAHPPTRILAVLACDCSIRSGDPALLTFTGKPKPLTEYHPSQFVLHSRRLHSGSGQRGGLLRPLLRLRFFTPCAPAR